MKHLKRYSLVIGIAATLLAGAWTMAAQAFVTRAEWNVAERERASLGATLDAVKRSVGRIEDYLLGGGR